MKPKRFLLAVLAGFVGRAVAYAILEGLLLKGYMEAIFEPAGASMEGMEGGPFMPLVAVLSMSLIMAYLYPKGYEGGKPLSEGLRFGVLLGLFSGIPLGIFSDVMFAIGFVPALVLIIVYVLETAAAGLFIGLVYGRAKRTGA